jgi:hypothetical protein
MMATRYIALVLLFVAPRLALAQDGKIVDRRMSFYEGKEELLVDTTFSELLEGRGKSVQSGLPTSIVLRLYVYERGKDLPIALRLVTIRLVYDLWDEVYLVRVDGPLGQRTIKYKDQAEAMRAATRLELFPIATLSRIEIGKRYFLAMVAELNPLSPELHAEVRGWLSKPTRDRELGMSSAFFGSFVSVFSNIKLPPADAVVRLRSQLFYRVKR